MIERRTGIPMKYSFGDWRPFDQKVYISDISNVSRALSWSPVTSPEEGIGRLVKWVKEKPEMFK